MRTIEAPMIIGIALAPDTFENCRSHYARRRGCRDPRNGKVGGKHLGHDQWAPQGTPILAPCDGTMRYISSAGDYGNFGKFQATKTKKGIWIAHCRDRLKLGDYRKGQEIGKVGTTGTQSTGPHCHSELHPDALNFNSVENIYPELLAASQTSEEELVIGFESGQIAAGEEANIPLIPVNRKGGIPFNKAYLSFSCDQEGSVCRVALVNRQTVFSVDPAFHVVRGRRMFAEIKEGMDCCNVINNGKYPVGWLIEWDS